MAPELLWLAPVGATAKRPYQPVLPMSNGSSYPVGLVNPQREVEIVFVESFLSAVSYPSQVSSHIAI